MPVHGADDREKNMETGLAVLFGVCCSVTDCKRRKITLSVLLAGAAAGCILSGIRIWQGTESAWEMFAAILPAVCLESVVILTAGKVGFFRYDPVSGCDILKDLFCSFGYFVIPYFSSVFYNHH